MIDEKHILAIKEWAKQKLAECDAGHDWWHIERVCTNAQNIYKKEGGDWDIIYLSVLLHDVADGKYFNEVDALMQIEHKLDELSIPKEKIEHILKIIGNMSFSKQWNDNEFDSLEFKIVQDADRLDAIGAIGIARAFSYGGHKGRDFYNPEMKPQTYNNEASYRASNSPTINHFYEKLLLLKDKMNTMCGKDMANDRHEFMLKYLEQFYKEWGE